MAKTGTLNISLGVVGDGVNIAWPYPAGSSPFTNLVSPGQEGPLSLSAGFNSIAVPTGAKMLFLPPQPGVTATLTLKGITGDTGIQMDPTMPFVFPCALASTIGITASGTATLYAIWV